MWKERFLVMDFFTFWKLAPLRLTAQRIYTYKELTAM